MIVHSNRIKRSPLGYPGLSSFHQTRIIYFHYQKFNVSEKFHEVIQSSKIIDLYFYTRNIFCNMLWPTTKYYQSKLDVYNNVAREISLRPWETEGLDKLQQKKTYCY